MGRKRFEDRPKRGKGKKAKRQQDPIVKAIGEPNGTVEKKLTSRQKVRLRKRVAKEVERQKLTLKAAIENPDKNKKKKKKIENNQEENTENSEEPSSSYTFDKVELDLENESEDSDAPHFMLEDADFLNEELEDGESSDGANEDEDDDDIEMDTEEAAPTVEDDDDEEEEEEEEPVDMVLNTDIDQSSKGSPPTDLALLDSRIKDILIVLNDFKGRRNPKKSRGDYVDELIEDLCSRYTYNEFLMRKLFNLFPNEIIDFLDANEVDRPCVIRTNTLKTQRRLLAQALINRGANADIFHDWSKVALTIYSSRVPIGATPEYLAGHYILQGASSLIPVMALAPKPDERILDLCAAPGGKTTYIAQLMRNTGTLVANEINRERAAAIVGNCHRMGVSNVIISNEDGREITRFVHDFDRVLVDAPCSGTGVIARDPSVKTSKTEEDILRCAQLQKQLLSSAIAACKTGGYIVYSTCSITVEENEAVIDYALKKNTVKLQETELFGVKGFTKFMGKHFHPSMERTRRYYPHKDNMDGFFVAKLKKVNVNSQPKGEIQPEPVEKESKSTPSKSPSKTIKKRKKGKKKSGFLRNPSHTDVTV